MASSASERSAGRAEQVYISAACSRNHATFARPHDGLVAFASGRLIALWKSADENHAGVHRTLPGHAGDVTALKFARSEGKSDCFVSGDAAGVARVWLERDGEWTHLATLTGHIGSISALHAFELDSNEERVYIVVTGGSDSRLRVWTVSQSGEANLRQTVDLKGKIALELALTPLPSSSSLVLAVGGTETRIQLYTSRVAGTELEFRKSLSLEGHTDWVRCLSFTTPIPTDTPSVPSSSSAYDIAPGEILLASGSQDNYIRLWRLSRRPDGSLTPSSAETVGDGLDALDALEDALASAGDEELRVKAHDFSVLGDGEYSCTSEAVLLGHDAWVTGLNWAPRLSPSTAAPLQLLSASADRSMILWKPLASGSALPVNPSFGSHARSSTASASVWTSVRRFGEFTSSTNLGFFGALWGLDGKTVLANGWGGSWHVWKLEGAEGMEDWAPQVAVSGHLATVKQVVWEGEGEYLLSASNDMSARLHAPWRRQVNGKAIETWHEFGRPQIHGYPLASVAFTSPAKRLQFVSGADEKIVRVFVAPRVWLRTLKTLSGLDLGDEEERPMAANVPPLGLSNRAIASPAEAEKLAPASSDPFEEVFPVNFKVNEHPALEEQLLGSTLWPEVEKLYGHAFELVSVASAHALPLIASACKATVPEHAVIRLFSTETWQPVGAVLGGHALTITKLAFSPGGDDVRDRWLLSVSRDRTFRLYERDESQGFGFYRPAGDAKPHARIIWDACWATDSAFFATASRDKTVNVWARLNASLSCTATLKFDEAATSVAATFLPGRGLHLLAVGLENGHVHCFIASSTSLDTWTSLLQLDSSVAHTLAVTTLSFSPKLPSPSTARLATGSEDHTVRIFDIAA
ncbi:RNA polymerase II elongator complex protein 2 [Rhodotorula toruloides]|uniref:Elongator complex protein 2 n=1 Tax=Rhodotorula toruloides TaxID=5286 RepID=A0A511KHQ7_RHOTO|nr:RNA polymerase II elongator complex protein 2 [Rhodotorula toruloides]